MTALEGVRVIDRTQVTAGPFRAMRLADTGAEVTRVEPPEPSETPGAALRPAPRLGRHATELLAEPGPDEPGQRALADAGVV